MKTGPYFVVLMLSVSCAILTVALIVIARNNQVLQLKLQAKQQQLNQGILGQQAQQISSGILQDLANSAATNSATRQLLEKHGYRLSPAQPQKASVDLPEKKQEESVNAEAGKNE